MPVLDYEIQHSFHLIQRVKYISGLFTKLVAAVGYSQCPCTVKDPKYEAGVVTLGLIQNRTSQPNEPCNQQHARQPEPAGQPVRARRSTALPLFHGRDEKNNLSARDYQDRFEKAAKIG